MMLTSHEKYNFIAIPMLRITAETDFRRCSSFVLSDFVVSAVRRSQHHLEEGRPDSARRILFVAGAAAFELARREGLGEEALVDRSTEILETAQRQIAEFKLGDILVLRRLG